MSSTQILDKEKSLILNKSNLDKTNNNQNNTKTLPIQDKENTNIKLAMSLSVKYGYKIPDVIFKVQEKIKSSIETMTGLRVTQININVLNIFFDTENKKKNNKK